MTVSSQTRGITFTGTGSASPFPLPFRFFNNSEVSAYLVESNGTLTPLALGVDYTLTGAGQPEIDGGATGTLTKTVPLAAGKKMYVARTLPAVQSADIVNQGEFFASLHEDVFDRLTMVDQQHAEELSRCVKTSPTDAITPDQLLSSIKASELNAAASAASAATSYDDFDDRYLGSKAADPATDNDGQPLIIGAIYWNTVSSKMRVWRGSSWAFVIERDSQATPGDTTPGVLLIQNAYNLGVGNFAKNKIINGKMEIAQAGTSFPGIASGAYSLDQWQAGYVTSAITTAFQQVDASFPAEFQYCLNHQVTTADTSIAAGDNYYIQQQIEGFNARDLIGSPITLSFWVKSAKTGVHCVQLLNKAGDRSYVMEYTIAAANMPQKVTLTVPVGLITAGTWNWTTGAGLLIRLALAAGTTFQTTPNAWQTGNFLATANQVNVLDTVGNIFAITGVQLERGSVATPFEHRQYGQELALCQRYYIQGLTERRDGRDTAAGRVSRVWVDLPVQMRAAPTTTQVTAGGIGPQFATSTDRQITITASSAAGDMASITSYTASARL